MFHAEQSPNLGSAISNMLPCCEAPHLLREAVAYAMAARSLGELPANNTEFTQPTFHQLVTQCEECWALWTIAQGLDPEEAREHLRNRAS